MLLMESRVHAAMLLSLIGLSAGEHSERREDGLRLEFDISTEIVNNMAGFPGSDASAPTAAQVIRCQRPPTPSLSPSASLPTAPPFSHISASR